MFHFVEPVYRWRNISKLQNGTFDINYITAKDNTSLEL